MIILKLHRFFTNFNSFISNFYITLQTNWITTINNSYYEGLRKFDTDSYNMLDINFMLANNSYQWYRWIL